MTGSSKIDTTSINAKQYDWFRVHKDFMKSKKQDDLADCFLQALWFLKNI